MIGIGGPDRFDSTQFKRLDAAAALDVLEQAEQAKRQAEVVSALAMLQMVKSYRHDIPRDKVQLGADGTPWVDDFACLELAAALGRSAESMAAQVSSLLNLAHRLPTVWSQVVSGAISLWLGRELADLSRSVSLEQALWIDATIAPFTTRLARTRLIRFAEALVVRADPAAADARWAKRHGRKVELGPTTDTGLREIYGWLDAADAVYLDASLAQLSDILATTGSTEDADARRATALGILATPARALSMIQHAAAQPALPVETIPEPVEGTAEPVEGAALRSEPASVSKGSCREASTGLDSALRAGSTIEGRHCFGHTCGTITVAPDRLLPKATLIVHISDHTLATGDGIARCDQLGPLTRHQLIEILGHTRVTVQPVFDPDGIVPVDSYEIPESIRRAVLLRHPYEVFPYSHSASPGADLDHTRPWKPGRKGQTHPDNLGPLRRKRHRAKTHADWRLQQPAPGQFVWTTPLGRQYLITASGLTIDTRLSSAPISGPLLPEPPTSQPQSQRRRPLGARPRRPSVLRR